MYNYYTATEDEDATDDDDAAYEYSRLRRAIGAASPMVLAAGVGLLLAQQQSKKRKVWVHLGAVDELSHGKQGETVNYSVILRQALKPPQSLADDVNTSH